MNLAQNVSAIRRALGGDDKKAYVETVAGAGYRFVAPVRIEQERIEPPAAARLPRLLVLPFRVLTPGPDIDFLSFSLPDALSGSLSGLDTLLVRSSLTAAKYASDADPARVAREADVNLVVSGTILRARDELRVTVQLSDAEAGTLLWSHAESGRAGDLFALQDALVERIVGSLAQPPTLNERARLRHDVPASPRAYEYYLRANQASVDEHAWPIARDLYLQAIEEDPRYAPAWARLARVYRLIGKYRPDAHDRSLERAEEALRRALALNPDLGFAHTLYAQVECDKGRAEAAMVRLLARMRERATEADVYAGLVHACRYCGLLDASVAAHLQARTLDATIPTSVMHTYFVMRDYDAVLAESTVLRGYVYVLSLFGAGRRDEALREAAALTKEGNRVQEMIEAAGALIEGRADASAAVLERASRSFNDPEAWFYAARHYSYLGHGRAALDALGKAIDGGYFCHGALVTDEWFDAMRGELEYPSLESRARKGHESAVAAFTAAQGSRTLEP